MRSPRPTCVSDGNPLRRLLVVSKAGVVLVVMCFHSASFYGMCGWMDTDPEILSRRCSGAEGGTRMTDDGGRMTDDGVTGDRVAK